MLVKGITEKQIIQTAKKVGVAINGASYHVGYFNGITKKGNYLSFTLRIKPGAPLDVKYRKYGFSGRRTYHICYHGHYEFMRRLYEINPNTIIRSTMAVYKNKEEFERLAGFVSRVNVGNAYQPQNYGEKCDCEVSDHIAYDFASDKYFAERK